MSKAAPRLSRLLPAPERGSHRPGHARSGRPITTRPSGCLAVKTLLEKYRKDREQIAYLKQEYAVGGKDHTTRGSSRSTNSTSSAGIPILAMEWFSAPNMKARIRQGLEKIGHMVPRSSLQATEAPGLFPAKAGSIATSSPTTSSWPTTAR